MTKRLQLGTPAFRVALANQLLTAAGQLFALRMRLLANEIEAGFACFHAAPHWFATHLHAPLLNEPGQQFALEMLKHALAPGIYRDMGLFDSARWPGYRSHLYPGQLDAENARRPSSMPRDEVANEITLRLAREANRHFAYEISQRREAAWCEKLREGRLTPEPVFVDRSDDIETPVRDASVPIEHDGNYWAAVYAPRIRRAHDFSGVEKPDWILELMAAMGPDFPIDKTRSTKSALRFVDQGEGEVAWAIQFVKTSIYFDHRPRLVCLPRRGKLKAGETPIEFPDQLINSDPPLDMSARGIECALPYWLPRLRTFAEHLDPLVSSVLTGAA